MCSAVVVSLQPLSELTQWYAKVGLSIDFANKCPLGQSSIPTSVQVLSLILFSSVLCLQTFYGSFFSFQSFAYIHTLYGSLTSFIVKSICEFACALVCTCVDGTDLDLTWVVMVF